MDLSIVVPVYNEEENIPLLHQAITHAVVPLDLAWEVILVDDGSQDGSLAALQRLAEDDPQHVRVVQLRRNFGQTAAIAAGIDYSSGEVVVLLDADLQNDPEDIPLMLEQINAGYDVVSGWRVSRQDDALAPTALADGQRADLGGDRCAPARLRLHAEGLPARGDHRLQTVRRDAPLYPGVCQLGGRADYWKCRCVITRGALARPSTGWSAPPR